MSETFDLAIHLGPGVAQLKDDKSNLNIDRDNVDGDSETGQLTSKPKKGYFSIILGLIIAIIQFQYIFEISIPR